tara:strand:- start:4997 stop:6184 length:1188 start_codon:yes stop_codon:yes gene_type:complete
MNIYTGKKFFLKRKITKKDIKIFSNLSGDKNPIHIDQEYSKKMGFGKIVAHGMLSETFISAIIGNNLPGPGSLWAEKNIKFLKIVREGDIVILKSEIIEIHETNNLAIVEIKAFNQFKELVFDSINKIILPKNAKVKKNQNSKKKVINKELKKEINVKKNLAIIIGASGGIGIEVTKKLLKKNFDVIAFYNSSFKDLKKIKTSNKNLSYFNLNLKSKKSLEKCLNIIKKNHPTHFINCFSPKIYPINFDKITDQDFDHYFDKSLINIFLIIKECVKRFKLVRRGNIIDISSIYLKLPELNLLPYITFKGSMSAMIKSLSAELASYNIRANTVMAGVTDTQQISDMSYKQKLLLAAKTPLQRIAKPVDIANVVYFLSSNESEFITGSSIDVNGGII